ncbi:MAG: hypothetical protein R8K21_04915 [Mariprofundales bacterium]
MLLKKRISHMILYIAILMVIAACAGGGDSAATTTPTTTPTTANNANIVKTATKIQTRNQAVLGPLAQASVDVYSITDLYTVIFHTTTDSYGEFAGTISNLLAQDYILVAVTGGQDIDANDDGIIDILATPNTGVIFALSTVTAFNSGVLNVSAITDIAWRYTKNLVGNVANNGLKIRLDDLARTFIAADINGDGVIDTADLLAFKPQNITHKSNINFNYQALFVKDVYGESLIDSYHLNKTDKVDALLDVLFGNSLTRFAEVDARYQSVKIELLPFGDGIVTSSSGGINYDSTKTANQNIMQSFYPIDPYKQITFTATPTVETQILGWVGCDTVSPDKTTCIIPLTTDRQIEVNFGYIKAQVVANLIDLSLANTSFANQIIDVRIPSTNAILATQVANLIAGDFVVGSSNGGFLEKVVSVTQVNQFQYKINTVSATLEEVIIQGTGMFSKQMTNADLAADPYAQQTQNAKAVRGLNNLSPQANARVNVVPVAFRGIAGVRLVPSADINDEVFHIQLGSQGGANNPARNSRLSGALNASTGANLTKNVILYSGGGITATAKGSVSVRVKVNFLVNYTIFAWYAKNRGLREFKFINELDLTESLNVTVTGKGKTPNIEKTLGTIYFTPIAFTIGIVPVWITPQVDLVIGANAKIKAVAKSGITFRQTVRAGVHYKVNEGWKTVAKLDKSTKWTPPQMTADGLVVGYIKPSASLLFYNFTGPQISAKGSLALKAHLQANSNLWKNKTCTGGLDLSLWAGVKSQLDWSWKIPGNSKLGKIFSSLKAQVNVPVTLYDKEWLLTKWNLNGKCTPTPPVLEANGTNINDQIPQNNNSKVFTTDYRITNVGHGGDLNWTVTMSNKTPLVMSISPVSSGILAKGKSATITITANATNLPIGKYIESIAFTNPYTISSKISPTYKSGTQITSAKVTITKPIPANIYGVWNQTCIFAAASGGKVVGQELQEMELLMGTVFPATTTILITGAKAHFTVSGLPPSIVSGDAIQWIDIYSYTSNNAISNTKVGNQNFSSIFTPVWFVDPITSQLDFSWIVKAIGAGRFGGNLRTEWRCTGNKIPI